MSTLLITFPRPRTRVLSVPGVFAVSGVEDGHREFFLDARQAADVVEAWKASVGESALVMLAGSTWRLVERLGETGAKPWEAITWVTGREFWPISAFPFEASYIEGAAQQAPADLADRTLDALAEYLNQYPLAPAEVTRDFVVKLLRSTGRQVLA